MLDKLGKLGIAGILVIVVGIAIIAWKGGPILAGGIALVLAGVGLTAAGIIKSLLQSFGMGMV